VKILFISQRVPYPPNKGDKLRSFNEVKFLSQRHEISLVCLSDNHADLGHVRELEPYCASIDVVYLPKLRSKLRAMLALVSGKPLSLAYFYSTRLKAIVDRKLRSERFDVVFIYCSSMAQYVMAYDGWPRVIDFVDVDSEKWQQYAGYAPFPMNVLYRIESRRLREYERLVAQSFQHGFLVSEKEADDFRALVYGHSPLTPIANGVDTVSFSPIEQVEGFDPHALVFTGAMDYFANVEAVLYFVRDILPLIQERVPDVTFYIVGSNPTAEIAALPADHPRIVVTGFVEAVQPYVVRCAAMVAPMRIARGVQNKILEAMAMGVPVVTTSLGFEGILATPGADLFVEDAPQAFAGRVLQLMGDSVLRRRAAGLGRETVLRHYDWSRNLERLEQILLQMGKERGPATGPSE
jgi:polysaccharide biosynthesis protein PslH